MRWANWSGVAFVVLVLAAFFAYSHLQTVDGTPVEQWTQALAQNGRWAGISGFLHGIAGIALGLFVLAWAEAAQRRGEPVPIWGRAAGLAWAAAFVLGGALIFGAMEMAGYQAHPSGAKTLLVMGHLLYANPLAAFLGGAFAFSCGLSPMPLLARWLRPVSLVAGALGMAISLAGGIVGIGLIGMGPVALWILLASFALPLGERRGASVPTAA